MPQLSSHSLFIYLTVWFGSLSQIVFLSPRCIHSNQVPVLKDLVAANYSHLWFIFCSIFLNKQNKIYWDLRSLRAYGLLFSMMVHDTENLCPTLSPLLLSLFLCTV